MTVRLRLKALWRITRTGVTALYLFAGWMLFTWRLDPTNLVMGAAFSLFVSFFTYGLFVGETEASRRALIPHLPMLVPFGLVLVTRVVVAGLRLVPFVFARRFHPRIVHFRTRLRSELARVTLANAITLTPGTLTIDLDDDHLIVHSLNLPTSHSHYARKKIAESFERWLRRIWG
jgi:multicomponent Na+:H+ antiporter subunit E